MSLIDSIRYRWRVLFGSARHERELEDEIRFHLSLEAMQRRHAAHGELSSEDAHFAARRRFGNVTKIKEETREMSGLGFFDVVRQDVRFALRTLRRAPGFTAVAIATLAVGIGANTAIFSAVNAVLLRPLPFAEPDRLMKISLVTPTTAQLPSIDNMVWSYAKYVVFRDAQHVFERLALVDAGQFTITGSGDAERVNGEEAGAQYLRVLGIRPALGRDFLDDDDKHPGAPRVALLSDALWSRRFNANPAVLGTTIDIDAKPFTIVGVLPPGFRGLSGDADILLPLMARDADQLGLKQAYSHEFTLIGRLEPGVSPEAAVSAVRVLGKRVDETFSEMANLGKWGATARLLDETRTSPTVRRSLLVLLGAVAFVLLVACANVANLFLVRAESRRREIAIRLAVGAGRMRLVRQLLTESVLVALFGGVTSVLVAWWSVRLLGRLDPATALRVSMRGGLGAAAFSSIHLDVTAFAFAAALALATGILFGLVPAIQATRPALTSALKEGATRTLGIGGVRGVTSRNVLVVSEIALAVVLLAGAGLMVRSLQKLLGVDPGFDARNVLTMRLNVSPQGFHRDSIAGFYDLLLGRLASLPGARDAAIGNCAPVSGGCSATVIWFRDRPPVAEGTEPMVGVNFVTPSWFSVLHVPLRRGRMFTRADHIGTPKVVLVNETAARKFWPGEDPVGHRVGIGQGGFGDSATVIGVVGDVRFKSVDSLPKPDVFISYYQVPRPGMLIYVRASGDPATLAPAAQRVVREVAPDLPAYDVRTFESRLADATAQTRFSAELLAMFAVVALALAAMGIYGVMSSTVAQRTREIGIRVALGAMSADVRRMILKQGITLAIIGSVIGLGFAFAATRVLRSLLYGVAPSDPTSFALVIVLLVCSAALASWIPARRASRVEPTEALRDG